MERRVHAAWSDEDGPARAAANICGTRLLVRLMETLSVILLLKKC